MWEVNLRNVKIIIVFHINSFVFSAETQINKQSMILNLNKKCLINLCEK